MNGKEAGAQLALEPGAQPSDSGEAYSADQARQRMREMTAGRRMYFSDPFAYDFEGELDAAIERERCRDLWRPLWKAELPGKENKRRSSAMRRRSAEFEAEAERLAMPAGPRVYTTLDDFRRHVRRFGPECVVETARQMLPSDDVAILEAELAATRPRQRRTTVTLGAQVRDLQRRGMMLSAIANTLNISDRRVKNLIKSETSQNGAHKATVQAEVFAAKGSVHVLGRGRA